VNRRLVGLLLVFASAAAFGSGPLLSKAVYAEGLDWIALSAWRFLVGAGLTWAWLLVLPGGWAAVRGLPRRQVAVTVGLGVLFVANSGTYYAGLETVPASLAALLVFIYPVLVAVLSLRLGARLEGRRAWGGLGLAVAGVGLAVGGIDPTQSGPLLGVLVVIASPVIYAVWIILAARLSGERRGATAEARATAGRSAGAATAAVMAVMLSATAVAYWGIVAVTGTPALPGQVPAEAWPFLLAIGAVTTFLAIPAFYEGARRVGAATAALVSTFEPVWAISLAAIVLGESLTPVQIAGGGLIIGGVLLSQSSQLRTGSSQDRAASSAAAARAPVSTADAPAATQPPSEPSPRKR
jgi:drug/metabolite transporter (DMT)-like permease